MSVKLGGIICDTCGRIIRSFTVKPRDLDRNGYHICVQCKDNGADTDSIRAGEVIKKVSPKG